MTFYTASLLASGLASVILGLFVYLQGKDRAPNISLALNTLAVAVWNIGQGLGELAPSQASVLLWTRVNLAGAILIPATFLAFILSLTGELKSRRTILIIVAALTAGFLLSDLTPWFVREVAAHPHFRFYPVPGPFYFVFPFYLLAVVGYGLFKLFSALGRSYGNRRNQLFYVILASILGFTGGVTAFFPTFNIDLPSLTYILVPLYLIMVVYAILKHHLLDISMVIRRGLIYSILSLVIASFYILMILLLGQYFQNLTGWNSIVATALFVFVLVAVFEPLRGTIAAGVDRLFFRNLYREMLRADKLAALGAVAAGLAHEIKNPLASLKGMTQILPDNLDDPEFIKNYTEMAPRQLDRINNIVEALLRIARPQKYVLTGVDLSKILDDLYHLLENQARKKNIIFKKEWEPDLMVQGDAEQLMQVFMNLILNAMDSMPNGGTLGIGGRRREGEGIELEVSDSGVGIPAEKLKNVFEPFFTTKEGGTGLGLAVTYRIIKEHFGEIEVKSKVGEGTTFKIWLSTRPRA
ncbi:hypothetical protein HZC35_02150 [Candidatus Saganbacteria bacterium]|nr:hypothetical protein [Candidatus Saganbacteria bacterium]